MTAALRRAQVDASALAPVLVVGVPGLAFDYLENLESLAVSGRPIMYVGTCGAATADTSRTSGDDEGGSEGGEDGRPPAPVSSEAAAEQLAAVVRA